MQDIGDMLKSILECFLWLKQKNRYLCIEIDFYFVREEISCCTNLFLFHPEYSTLYKVADGILRYFKT